jgi:ankyrin repeat protein
MPAPPRGGLEIEMAMTLDSKRRGLWVYVRAPLMGVILGWAVVLGLAHHYAPAEVLACTFEARFEWDSIHGVKAFRLEDSNLGEQVGGRAWRYVVALQIKPALDFYLRRCNFQRVTGWGLVRVARVIPLAIPEGWGSDGMDFDTDVTPLMRAARKGEVDSVKRLLAEGADVNARDWMGRTAWLHACEFARASPQVVALLLAAGADPNTADRAGVTALMEAASFAEDNSLVILRNLLAAGANPNAKARNAGTSLMHAAGLGHLEAVRVLLQAGADVAARTDNGFTALSLAEQYRHPEVVQMLKQAGAQQ